MTIPDHDRENTVANTTSSTVHNGRVGIRQIECGLAADLAFFVPLTTTSTRDNSDQNVDSRGTVE